MAKGHGLGSTMYVSGYDFTTDYQSVDSIQGGPAALDLTGIDKSAPERQGGLLSGGIDSTLFFDKATDRSHLRLSPLPTGDQLVTYGIGSTIGRPAASLWSKQLNYDGTRANDGMLTFKVGKVSNGFPLEWGVQLTAGKRTDTGATAGASADLGSASPGAFGASAYLHVFSFTGTDATIKLQESSDDGAGDAFADVVGGAFTQVTAGPVYQRIQTAAINVERYLRVTTVTTGGFTSLVFAVMVNRYPVAVPVTF